MNDGVTLWQQKNLQHIITWLVSQETVDHINLVMHFAGLARSNYVIKNTEKMPKISFQYHVRLSGRD